MKKRIFAAAIAAGLVISVSRAGVSSPAVGSKRDEPAPKLIVEKADVSILGYKTDMGYQYDSRKFAATLKNAGTAVANDIRISIWPVFTDTLRIKLVPKEHYTKSIDKESGELYLTIPVLGKGESIRILFMDSSLPRVVKRTFKKEPLFPRFFWFHASCMQGSSVTDTIYTRWEEMDIPSADE